MQIFIKRRDGRAYAVGEYNDGKVVVKKGSRIYLDSLSSMKGFQKAELARKNNEIVDGNGNVKKDIEFNSPSMAAAFVLGQSTNGYLSWKDSNKTTLKELIK